MKHLLFTLLLFATGVTTYAKNVDETTARNAGYYHLLRHSVPVNSPNDLRVVYTHRSPATDFYVFSGSDYYVVVSAWDGVQPILGYSTSIPFNAEKIPDGLQFMFDCYGKQIEYAINNDLVANNEVASKWDMLSANPKKSGERTTSGPIVCPMLHSEWDQGSGPGSWWDDYCPPGMPAGCVATAMSQVMYYWHWPRTGIGYNSYFDIFEFSVYSSDFYSHPLRWSDMRDAFYTFSPPTYYSCPTRSTTSPSTYAEDLAMADAVSNLQSQAGISVNMMYNDFWGGSSSAFTGTAASALRNNFLYNATYEIRDPIGWIFDEAPWLNRINANLNSGIPVIYAGYGSAGGHCWVIDGYDADGFFNMNWGWGGSDEGIYTLNHLDPPGAGGTFDWTEEAIFDVTPHCANDVVYYSNSAAISAGGGYVHGGIYVGSSFGGSGIVNNNPGTTQWLAAQFIIAGHNFNATPTSGHFFEMEPTGCSGLSSHKPITDTVTHVVAVKPVVTEKVHPAINIYPNPVNDKIIIEYPCESAGALDIIIKDVSGRVRYTETATCTEGKNSDHTVDMSNYTPGVYIIDISLNEQHTIKKIIKL